MIKIYALATVALLGLQLRMRESRKDEQGVGTLEYVIIGLGLFLAATAAILVFRGAIDARLDQIR